jgi:hypothetical protein
MLLAESLEIFAELGRLDGSDFLHIASSKISRPTEYAIWKAS